MSHSFSKNHQHIVFSTAGRRRTITKEIQAKVWAYMAGICHNHKMFVNAIGGIEDHVHLLIELPPAIAVASAVRLVKSNSSKWLNEIGKDFAWQKGYAAFSVSASIIGSVAAYIRNQEAHHRKMSYEEELVALLKKHGVKYDPEHLFD
jgi:REP element-mobilizing transposase RayT